MDHPWRPAMKEEYVQIGSGSGGRGGGGGGGDASSSSSSSGLYFGNVGVVPRAMEGLNDAGPPPFVTKTFDMVDDPSTARMVSWSRGGQSFVVWDPNAFSTALLPKYFKHSNFSSFVRQLNTYGFRKIDPDRWEFANEGFLMGHKHLLKYVRRRKVTAQPMHTASQQAVIPCVVELGEYGGGNDAAEVDRLRRDKETLMLEIAKLKQHQQNTKTYLQTMEERIQRTEKKQRHMMGFIARAVQNPAFIHQLVQVQHKDKSKELEQGSSNGKRRWSMDQRCDSSRDVQVSNLSIGQSRDEYEVSELEALALEIQGYRRAGKAPRQDEEEVEFREGVEKEVDEEFWEELLLTGWLDIRDNKEVCKDEAQLAGNPWARTCTSSNKNSKGAK